MTTPPDEEAASADPFAMLSQIRERCLEVVVVAEAATSAIEAERVNDRVLALVYLTKRLATETVELVEMAKKKLERAPR